MKKILVLLLAVLLLAGCAQSSSEAKISNPDEVIFSSSKTTYTKGDLNGNLKSYNYSSYILIDMLNKIAVLKGYDLEKYKQDAKEYVQDMIDNGYEYYIDYQGGRDIVEKSYTVNYIIDELAKEEALKTYDEAVADDSPIKAQIAYFPDLDSINKAIEDINDGNTFDTAVLNNGYELDATPHVYIESDETLPLEVKTYISETSTTGLSGVITTSTVTTDADGNSVDTPRYYLVDILDTNPNNFKDEYLAKLTENVDFQTIINNVFAQYDIEFFDQDTYNLMSSTYEALK